MEKVKAAKRPAGYRRGGKTQNRELLSSLKSIVARHDAACTAMAVFSDAIVDTAARTEEAQLVKVALYVNRTTSEWHHLGDFLPAVLQLALAVREAGQP